MRIFLLVVLLIFGIQFWTKAEDITSFELEGISIGTSLLDYFSEQELNSKRKIFYPNSKNFFS